MKFQVMSEMKIIQVTFYQLKTELIKLGPNAFSLRPTAVAVLKKKAKTLLKECEKLYKETYERMKDDMATNKFKHDSDHIRYLANAKNYYNITTNDIRRVFRLPEPAPPTLPSVP